MNKSGHGFTGYAKSLDDIIPSAAKDLLFICFQSETADASLRSKVMQAVKGRRGTACRTLGPRYFQAEGYGKPYPYSHRGSSRSPVAGRDFHLYWWAEGPCDTQHDGCLRFFRSLFCTCLLQGALGLAGPLPPPPFPPAATATATPAAAPTPAKIRIPEDP